MCLISVIVPVYNAERFLRETIDSVLEQSYQELELILVNDGSTDGSQIIIEDYCKRDPRIIAVTTENRGAPHARNCGLQRAKGKYTLFLDADDTLLPCALECLLAGFSDARVELSLGGIQSMEGDVIHEMLYLPSGCFDPRSEAIEELLYLPPFPGNKLFLTRALRQHGLLFRDLKIAQDLDFYCRFLAVGGLVSVCSKPVVRYRIVEGSISHSYDRRVLEIDTCLRGIESFAREQKVSEEYLTAFANLSLTHYLIQMHKYVQIREPGLRGELIETLRPFALDTARKLGDRINDRGRTSLKEIDKY